MGQRDGMLLLQLTHITACVKGGHPFAPAHDASAGLINIATAWDRTLNLVSIGVQCIDFDLDILFN